jgi:glycosyltransferase involved in cell wall biosynthesis
MKTPVWVVLPTKNEAKNVEGVCNKLLSLKRDEAKYEIELKQAIFGVNRSTDVTDRVLEDIRNRPEYSSFITILHSTGRGSAMRDGIESIQDRVKDGIVVVMDSDGEIDPSHIPNVVDPLIKCGYVASVAGERDGRSDYRKIISRVGSILYGGLLDCEDAQSGIKAILGGVALDTIPKDVPGLDIDIRWMNEIVRKHGRGKISRKQRIKLEKRKYGKTSFSPIILGLGLFYTTLSLYLHRRIGKELPFPRTFKKYILYSNE